MHKKILGFLGSVGVALALGAVGVIYDAKLLLQASAILLGAVVVAWLLVWANILPSGAGRNPTDDTDLARKRKLIDAARGLASRYASDPPDASFRQFLEGTRTYASIRGHLSQTYLDKLNASRTAYLSDGAGKYEPLVEWFLDDLDRLERKWGLS